MQILLAEDDVRLGEAIAHYLNTVGMQAEWVTNGKDALDLILRARETPFDVVILDWMMPGLNGPEVVVRLREGGFQRAVMLLTARDSVDDRIHGLSCGADDYLVKPFAMQELVARIHALSRRNFATFESKEIRSGPLVLDRLTHKMRHDEMEVLLTQKEFALLEWLIRHPSRVFSKSALLERIWGSDSDVTLNAVEACVKLLRKKLESVQAGESVETIRGVGYRYQEQRVKK